MTAVTATTLAPLGDPGLAVRSRWAVSDTLQLTKRNLLVWFRVPAYLVFTVIQPAQNQANQALKSGLQQSQQVINQAQKQLKTNGTGGTGGTAAGSQAQQTLSKAAKLTACVQSAGTDPSALASCQSKFGH